MSSSYQVIEAAFYHYTSDLISSDETSMKNCYLDKVVVHDGIFHPDDVVATAIVTMITCSPEITIVRTRNNAVIQDAMTSKTTVILDVGRVFDPDLKAFDHHQPSFKLTREDTDIPYSSAGLAWKFLAQDRLSSMKGWQYLDDMLIKPIDMLDNGREISKSDDSFADAFTTMINNFNPTWLEDSSGGTLDTMFARAVTWARDAIIRMLESKLAANCAEKYVDAAFYRSELLDRKVVVLNAYAPWQETLCKHHDPLFVIFPDASGLQYRLQCVPQSPDSFVSRKPLPKSWAGLDGEDLDAAAGIKGCVFCHKGRFIAGNKDFGGIVEMAIQAVNNTHDL